MLLIHRFKHGSEYWVVPGGGVEEGETIDEALAREVIEETGLGLISYRFLLNEKVQEKIEVIEHYIFGCEVEEKEPVLGGPELESQTTDNQYHLEWVGIEKVSELVLYPRIILKCHLDWHHR